MAKKNTIKDDFSGKDAVIGISSNEKIWKVAWELNRALGMNLEVSSPAGVLEGEEQGYEDRATSKDLEFFLIENRPGKKKLPAIVKEFRFWLFLRPQKETLPDTEKWIGRIRKIPGISLAVDISGKIDSNDWIA